MTQVASTDLVVLGWREWVGAAGLGLPRRAREGRQRRAQFARCTWMRQWRFTQGGAPWVGFRVCSPARGAPIEAHAPVARRARGHRLGRPSRPPRCSCAPRCGLAGVEREIEINLADRAACGFRCCWGAPRWRARSLVDPARSFLHGRQPPAAPIPIPEEAPMKLAILSRNSKLYSTRRLVEAARERGHTVRVLDPLRCYMRIASDGFEMHYKGTADLRLRRGDPAHRRIDHPLRHRGAAPVRADGQLHPQPVRRDPARARQAALPPVAGRAGHRPAGHGVRRQPRRHRRPAVDARPAAARHQAQRRHPGRRRDADREAVGVAQA